MFPVLVEIAGFKINSYGFFIAVGYLAALALGRYLAKSRNLDPSPYMDLGFVAIVSGVIGARILFVITTPDYFWSHPKEVFDFWSGGLVFYGGFFLALMACLAYGFWKRMPIWLSTDIVSTGVAFAHGFGRLGCLAAGCCHGNLCPYPWAIHNNSEYVEPSLRGQPIHPVQIYESVLLFLLAGTMAYLVKSKKTADGTVAVIYLMGYAGIRFVTEFFRGDLDRGFVGGSWISTSQGIALFLFAFGCGILIRRFRSNH